MNYYPFNIGDYAKHTKYLSMHQDLAYRRLIDLYYINEGPIAADIEAIAESIGFSDYVLDVSKVLSKFFLISEGFYRNERCDEVIAEYHAKADRAKGANKSRWKNNKSDSSIKSDTKSDVKSEQSHIPTNNQETITNNQEESKARSKEGAQPSAGDESPNDDPIGLGDDLPGSGELSTITKETDPIWHTGLSFLVRKGIPTLQARKMLGKLRQNINDIELIALLVQCEADDISEPIPWLSARTARRKQQQENQPQKLTRSRQGQAIENLNYENNAGAGMVREGNNSRAAITVRPELGRLPGS